MKTCDADIIPLCLHFIVIKHFSANIEVRYLGYRMNFFKLSIPLQDKNFHLLRIAPRLFCYCDVTVVICRGKQILFL
jgi:hypothetical protein